MQKQEQEIEFERRKLIESLQRSFFGERFVGATLSNVRLHSGLATDVSSFLKNPKYFLVILGSPGTGKTYMCSAFLDYMPMKSRTFRAYSERQLFERLRKGISSGQSGDYLSHLHEIIDDDLIIVDDIGSSGHNAWREEVLMEMVDYRYKDGKKSVFTSNLTREEFRQIYGERISSRLFSSQNTIVELFGMPDLRQQGL